MNTKELLTELANILRQNNQRPDATNEVGRRELIDALEAVKEKIEQHEKSGKKIKKEQVEHYWSGIV